MADAPRAAPSSAAEPAGGTPGGARRELFSGSVRAALGVFSDGDLVSPSALAAALRDEHPNYGAGRLGAVELPTDTPASPLEWLLERIVGMHDLVAIEAARQRIHTRMALLDLADLDAGVAAALGDDLRAVLLAEVEVHHGGMFRRADSPVGAFAPKISGFRTDDLTGPDQLQMTTDIETVARLLAAADTRPPLAVGLFGEWGTGKSFFMGKLAAEIGRLASLARDQADAGFVSPYCEHIVQIPFNAWHYVDANLWANLMTRIWEGLGAVDGSDRALDAVFANLESTRAARRQAELDVDAANQRLVRLDEEIATLESVTRSVDLDDAAVRDELEAQVARVSAELGVSADVSGLRDAVAAHRRVAGRLGLAWKNLSQRRRTLLAGLVAAAAVLAAVVWIVGRQEVVAAVVALATVAGGLVPVLSPVLSKINRSVLEADALLGAVDRRRQAELQELGRRRAGVEADRRAALVRRDAAQRDLDELRSGRGVQRFIRERAASADYREQLGLIALVRRDLETLSAMLVPPEDDLSAARRSLPGAPPKLDRIVLYIDDLDRCPPERVVEVLQAVHLLLAFPLFVVVVAVDPRWLMSSLDLHLRRQVVPVGTVPLGAVPVGTGPAASAAVDQPSEEWTSTPSDYLEKIFQLTLALAPMDKEGYGRLIRSLIAAPDRDGGRDGGDGDAPGEEDDAGADAGAGGGDDPVAPAAPPEIPVASQVGTFALRSPPRAVAFVDDGRGLVVVTADGAQLWQAPFVRPEVVEIPVRAHALSRDGSELVLAGDRRVMWVRTDGWQWNWTTIDDPATVVAASGDHDLFAYATADGVVHVWERAPIAVLAGSSITALAFGSDDRYLLAAVAGGLHVIDRDEGAVGSLEEVDLVAVSDHGFFAARPGRVEHWYEFAVVGAGANGEPSASWSPPATPQQLAARGDAAVVFDADGGVWEWSHVEGDRGDAAQRVPVTGLVRQIDAPAQGWRTGVLTEEGEVLRCSTSGPDLSVPAAAGVTHVALGANGLVATASDASCTVWRSPWQDRDAPGSPQLRLDHHEIEFIAGLDGVVSTPRAAKRLINTYLLLRASPTQTNVLRDATSDHHKVVLLLLAVIVGLPDHAEPLLGALVSSTPPASWADLLRKADLPAAARRALQRHSQGIKADIGTYAVWARRLARYSFRTAQLVFNVDSDEPARAAPAPAARPAHPANDPPGEGAAT